VVAQKFFTIPWKDVATIAIMSAGKSGLPVHGKPLFLCAKRNKNLKYT
jgi:hypothetical protein